MQIYFIVFIICPFEYIHMIIYENMLHLSANVIWLCLLERRIRLWIQARYSSKTFQETSLDKPEDAAMATWPMFSPRAQAWRSTRRRFTLWRFGNTVFSMHEYRFIQGLKWTGKRCLCGIDPWAVALTVPAKDTSTLRMLGGHWCRVLNQVGKGKDKGAENDKDRSSHSML